jgi:phage-related protein
VRREWAYFDFATIVAEFGSLPAKDRAKLMALLEHFRTVGAGNPSPAQIDDYGGGLHRLRHVKSAYQGRALFFVVERTFGFERLIVLTVYKKESQETPDHVLARAWARMAEYLRRNKP